MIWLGRCGVFALSLASTASVFADEQELVLDVDDYSPPNGQVIEFDDAQPPPELERSASPKSNDESIEIIVGGDSDAGTAKKSRLLIVD